MNENKKGAVLRGLRGFTHLIEEMGAHRSKQKRAKRCGRFDPSPALKVVVSGAKKQVHYRRAPR
ncbi:hypothetical protein [Caballeronia sp. AZ7_KS35]|uniref:hypothetical protein n=1 Tax=Caballeronia sp. AZ7_KS35 TaxID=2921762 RepID=UPI002027C1FB|nr:hypothetical protein [Caballeronia sp. AZ7_KS35]